MQPILIVEDKESLARMLQETLASEGMSADVVHTAEDALSSLRAGKRYAAVLTDLRLPGRDGIEVLREVRELDSECPVIVMTGYGTVENAVEAMKLGAWDFIQKPIDTDHLLLLLQRCREHRELRFENLLLKEEFQKRHDIPAIIGEDPQMQSLSEEIRKVAATDSTVLLQGESGTGKELFARAIHKLSARRDRPFVAINCAAIPETLIENELFGHERGAYTGASSRQIGKFELAGRGTVFLDEIGELGIGVQSKVLRVLQEKNFDRIGGLATITADVRVICATNRDLREEVRRGRFRDDLFFRINVFPIEIPPLRRRRGDIDALSDFFVERFAREMGKARPQISEAARDLLRSHDWPGNIRELQNALERAVILCEGTAIRPTDLKLAPGARNGGEGPGAALDLSGTLAEVVARTTDLVERLKIEEALRTSATRAEAAEKLGISVRTLLARLKEYGDGSGEGEK